MRRLPIVAIAVLLLIVVAVLAASHNDTSPLAKCKSEIAADAHYANWDGSLPAYCTGKTYGNYTLTDSQVRQASQYANQLIENGLGNKPGHNVPYPG